MRSKRESRPTAAKHTGQHRTPNTSDLPPPISPPQGVPLASWLAIGAEQHGNEWRTPERDATGTIIGTQRRLPTGRKVMVEGSRRGLVYADPLADGYGDMPDLPIFVVEGATDTAAAHSLALVAVGRPSATGGADHLANLLAGRYVAVLGENDRGVGQTAPYTIADRLAGTCAGVCVVFPPKEHKDLRAWVSAGATADDVLGILRHVEPVPTPEPHDTGRARPVVLNMADVEATPISWLWTGRVAVGRITIMAGHPGCGKSMVTADMAARVSTGTAWPDGMPCPRGRVLLLSAEDDPSDTIKPRLVAAGADCARVDVLTASTFRDKERVVTLADVDIIEAALRQHDDYRLLVVDPIGSYMGAGVDSHKDNETRAVLAPIAAIARPLGVAVLVVAHTRKGRSDRADDAVLGSRAFTGLARCVLHLAEDPYDKARKLLLPGKNNLAKPPAGLAFTIEGDPPACSWSPEPVHMTADDLLDLSNNAGASSAHDEAEAWLIDVLSAGPTSAKNVQERAKADGIAMRTLHRAKRTLNVQSTRLGYNEGAAWVWTLPSAELGNLGNLRPESD
ncbi:MAG: AAA family ATPase [Phycisphaerales bacterium]